uniref:SFI1 centrin binding protein n=1 Tax=Microcebus murinus TaxID=30608 RepID=A0A8C6ELE5_MICMU
MRNLVTKKYLSSHWLNFHEKVIKQRMEKKVDSRFYYEQRILQKVFDEWKEEWWVSHHEWKLCVRADCHYRMWWSEWRQRLGQVRVSCALHASADKRRALSLQLRAWSQWREQFLHDQREKEKMVSAVKHHQHWQKRRFLKAWLEYLQIRRMKRQQNEMAERFHHVTVLQIHLCSWQWAWQRRESLHAHRARVEELARRMALRRALTRWKHYMLLHGEEAAQREMAEEHRRHSLLNFGFRALKDNVTRAHLHRIRRNLACQQHDVTLLRRFWNLWQSRIEQREEKEHLPLLCAAWDHYRITLLCKCIKLWLQYTQKQRYQQLLQARADSHFQQRALPAAFHAWYRLWRWHQQERVLHTRATLFHRKTLEKQVFAHWWQKMFVHREDCLAERMAILQAERQLLRRSWSTWCQQAAARHQEREWQMVACAHHGHRRLRKAFCIWREGAQGLRTERTGRAQAAEFHSARLLRWAWNRWRECLALRGAERQKLVLADQHRQRRLLHRALRTWVTYQGRMRRVLQEVAARESQHHRQLLRGVLRRWREHTVARVDEARKTSLARAHYRRTMCSKVLAQWRETASVQIYYRQQEDCAIREARKVLDRGCLRTWFRRWRDRGRRVARQKVQLERAARHHHRQLLLGAVAGWKTHHLGCVRKRLLQWQGAQLLAWRLRRACFHQWRQQLAARRREQQATARALWFWAFSLQAKAWAAWLGFVQERRRKKARLERAAQAHHRQLLAEGAACLLRFAAATKASRQQLQAQQQVQAAHKLHRAVRHCATLWKQKVLGCGREPRPPAPIVPSRRVTFEGPLLDPAVAGAGDDATRETKRPRAPQPRGALGSLALATGEPHLPELSAACSARKQPRRPHFLLEPVQSQWPEKLQECGLSTTPPAGPFLLRATLAEAPKALVPSTPLPGALSGVPGPKLPPTASTGPELLLPPSSFMPRGAEAPARASALATTPKLKPQAPPSLAAGPDPYLLLPGDFTDTRAGPGPETAGCVDLEAELEGIQQQLQHYQATKQNLWSCQRQASSLRRWLELSREEPRPEDREVELQVQQELEEVELQIQQLAEELQAQRQPIRACVARIQALRRSLC